MTADEGRDGVRAFGGWNPHVGHLNAAVYPPGVPCDAMSGCPVNPHCWSVVTGFPGTETLTRCFPSEAEAEAFVRSAIR
jgi:hypothetical protein